MQSIIWARTIELTTSDKDELNAFQMKGLRRILKIPPKFIDRA